MDEAAIRAVRARAREALSEVPPAGVLGLAAITECARLLATLEGLSTANAKESLETAREVTKTLEAIAATFAKGGQEKSLQVAFGRFATVAESVARSLGEAVAKA